MPGSRPGNNAGGRFQVAKPFDITTKHLVESRPADWLAFAGMPTESPVSIVDADLSMVSAEADKVLRVEEAIPWLVNLELQASYDQDIGNRTLGYSVML